MTVDMPIARLLADFENLKKSRRTAPVEILQTIGKFSAGSLKLLREHSTVRPFAWTGRGARRYSIFILDEPGARISRAVNTDQFIFDPDEFISGWSELLEAVASSRSQGRLIYLDAVRVNALCYSAVMSWAAAVDLFKPSNGLAGTYFEILTGALIGNLSGRDVGSEVKLPVPGGYEKIKVDLTFEANNGRPCLVVPTKISTRERISQAYVHARILETARPGDYRTIICVVNETNTVNDAKIKEIDGQYPGRGLKETLVPGTIALYQKYIAQLEGMYYLDPPASYLAGNCPGMPLVRPYGHLLTEDLPYLLE
ncbi:hypothetical protein [Actinokineospora sp.]|uniref:hypothetical protein n=1 Tax=Actinokineospora sp. TaxID=1872133 RepID=UPI0040377A62